MKNHHPNVDVVVCCPVCEESQTIAMPTEAHSRWCAGEFIQDAWPEGSEDEREALLSGTCGECWERIFMVEEF